MRRRHGQANIEEHPKGSGRYRVRVRISGTLKTIGSKLGASEAEEIAAGYTVLRNEQAFREGLTLTQFSGGFLERREERGIRSAAKDANRWKTCVDPHKLGGLAIASLERADILEWLDWLQSKRRLSVQSRRNALNLLRVALDEALDRKLLKSNPAKEVRIKRYQDTTTHEDLSGVLTLTEQQALMAAVPEHERAGCVFALVTGLRWSELAWLEWDDVRPDHVLVRRSVGGKPTKSGKPRRVDLLEPAKAALIDAAHRRIPECPWVFPGSDGTPRVNRPRGWLKWVAAAGIERRVRFHDLRHTCATSLLAGWWNRRWTLDEVCKMLGHSSITVTERYARKLDETLTNAVLETKFPGGNGFALLQAKPDGANAFLNRRSAVRLCPGAQPNSAGSIDTEGTVWEQTGNSSNQPNSAGTRDLADPSVRAFRALAWTWFARRVA